MAAAMAGTSAGFVMGNLSLYVGDLDRNVNEGHLCDVFSTVAPVMSVKVCRDQLRQTSLGYAYVNFSTPQDAATAREKLNFTQINGKPMRIMFSHRDPSMRKSGFANVFIKNLDASIDNKALFDTFTTFGNVLSCKVATDSSGQSKGYGFVQFDHEDAAQRAIQNLDGMLINEKKVYVALFVRRTNRNLENGSRKFTNVYVKNFPDETTEDDFKNMFSKFGNITSAIVMRDTNGHSRGFGFVNFESVDSAAAAVEGMNGIKLSDDKVLYVGRAQKKGERVAELRARYEQERNSRFERLQGANLYLKNLEDSFTEESLKELFSEFGTITSCKIMRDANGASKGSGFVAFSTSDEAARALNDMNGKLIGRKPLYVAVAQRKEERRALLQAQFAQLQVPFPQPGFYPAGSTYIPQQLYYGHGMAGGLFPQQHASYAYQQQFVNGMSPRVPQNYSSPMHYQRGPNGRSGSRRGGSFQPTHHQQWMLRNKKNLGRYMANGNGPNGGSSSIVGHPIIPVPFNGGTSSSNNQPVEQMPMSTHVNQQMLGEQLFPLVQQLEPDHAGKITGMLLEMDPAEIIHLIESAEALKEKVAEAMVAFRAVAASGSAINDQ